MSTLPDNAPLIKKFLNGDHGWAHAAQEAGALAFFALVGTWLISIVIAVIVAALVYKFADQYWIKREIKQSKKMGRTFYPTDLAGVPSKPTQFWTQDAIEDVKYPRSLRKPAIIIVLVLSGIIASKVGIFGVLMPW